MANKNDSIAIAVLRANENTPMSTTRIWEFAVKYGIDKKFWASWATPWESLSARLYTVVKDPSKSLFNMRKVWKAKEFWLKDINTEVSTLGNTDGDELFETTPANNTPQKYPYKERDIHPWVVHFGKYGLNGVCIKTIYHEGSSKKTFGEWVHPDLVGFYFPFDTYTKEVLSLGKTELIRFYSFELKREISLWTLRESFFQAVSNSSWANEGYLVAPNIQEDSEFQSQLARLSESFGIWVIEIDLWEPEQSRVLYPARRRNIDWNQMDYLADKNPDFRAFLRDVEGDIQTKKLHESEYDSQKSSEELIELLKKFDTK